MAARLFPLLRIVSATFLVLFAVDSAIFRSGLYPKALEPQSTAGATLRALRVIDYYYQPGKKNVLVLGNSRIGEGFSMATANETIGRDDVNFINGAVPGSSVRIWHYLLKEADPNADRFHAIVLTVPYESNDVQHELANNASHINYLAPLLGLRDIVEFPASFTDPDLRQRARRTILFPANAYHSDVIDLVRNPGRRWESLKKEQANVSHWIKYRGRAGALPNLPIDATARRPSDWMGLDRPTRASLETYFRNLGAVSSADLQARNAEFLREWLERIVARYRDSGVRLIVVSVPRGPWHKLLSEVPRPDSGLTEMIAAGDLVALPADPFVELEQPEFFYDTLHMNAAGRTRFSELLAQNLSFP